MDSIDLEILQKIKGKKLGIMQLKEQMGLHHQNLKPHVDKLRKADLIKAERQKNSPKIELSLAKKSNSTIQLLKKLKKSRH